MIFSDNRCQLFRIMLSATSKAIKRTGGLPEINSRQLAAVLAVAEYRSFIAAAAHLGISQPALTLAIKPAGANAQDSAVHAQHPQRHDYSGRS